MSNQHLTGINIVDINDSENFSIESLTDAELEALAGAGWLGDIVSGAAGVVTGAVGGAVGAVVGAVGDLVGADTSIVDGAKTGGKWGWEVGTTIF